MQRKIVISMLLTLLLLSAIPVHADELEERSFEDETIYFIMVDRFNNGDASNDFEIDHNNPAAYHGGDIQGIISKLDYIKDMGFTSVLVTPVFSNGANGFDGYSIENYRDIEEHFGTLDDFKNLVISVHERNMKLILDLGLRSINEGITEEELVEAAKWWIQETDIDGYKVDITEDSDVDFLSTLTQTVKSEKEGFLVIGQPVGMEEQDPTVLSGAGFDSFFNQTLYKGVTSFSLPDQEFEGLERDWELLKEGYENPNKLLSFMDNQDTIRFTYLPTEQNEHPAPRIKLALAYMYTAPGVPIVYYGTEIALNGAEPPLNSGLMDFRTDQELVEYIRLLSKVRASVPALTKGTFEILSNKEGMLLFKREFEGQTAYIAINNTLKSQKFTFKSEEIGTNKELKGLLTEELIRSVDDEFNMVVERDMAEVYLVQDTTKINFSLFIAVFIVPLLMIGFIYLNKKRHSNHPKPE